MFKTNHSLAKVVGAGYLGQWRVDNTYKGQEVEFKDLLKIAQQLFPEYADKESKLYLRNFDQLNVLDDAEEIDSTKPVAVAYRVNGKSYNFFLGVGIPGNGKDDYKFYSEKPDLNTDTSYGDDTFSISFHGVELYRKQIGAGF